MKCVLAACLIACSAALAQPAQSLDDYNVVWTTPSKDASGSMPLGNGEVGLNAWVEENGDLVFYISRVDSWSECERLLKVGKIRVTLDPPLLGNTGEKVPFRQELRLREGAIAVTAGAASLTLYVDAASPVVVVEGRFSTPRTVRAAIENWRTAPRTLDNAEELQSSWAMREAPASVPRELITESADVILNEPDAVAWYHRNERSIVPFTLHRQGLDAIAASIPDPFLHRTFGGWMVGTGMKSAGAAALVTPTPTREFQVRIAVPCAQSDTTDEWRTSARQLAAPQQSDNARARTSAWWEAFWQRSWVYVENDAPLKVGADSTSKDVLPGHVSDLAIAREPFSALRVVLTRVETPDSREPTVQELEEPLSLRGKEQRIFDGTGRPSCRVTLSIPRHLVDEPPELVGCFGSNRLSATLYPKDEFHGGTRPVVANASDSGTPTETAAYIVKDMVWKIAPAASDPAPPSRLTQAYILQRYMLACASRGSFPPKFNGSIFTVEPKFTGGQPFNADWRKWGGSYWWQNTRLPYYPMLAAGDFDGMHSLFDYYERCLPACRARAKLYYGADGVYFPETMTTFATYANGDYGWNRDGLAPSDIAPCPWWQWAWQQGLELSQLMLDYAAYTDDEAFLREHAIPMANESLRYYDTRFKRDSRGKLIISPTQAIETYWKGVVNDAPSVAGLHAVCDMLLALPPSVGTPEDRAFWARMKDAAPELPVLTKDGVTMCAPAEKYDPARSNCETPELYAVFPFRLYGLARPNLEHAIEAYKHRVDKSTVGWTQDGMVAALLGLTDEAKANLLAKCRNSNKNFRFPAMWGPNFDWLPDQDHGSNLMTATQLMLMQCDGDAIRLLPAWPKEWNVSFKLHAPKETTVECIYKDGKVQDLKVTPESRRADVVLPPT